MPQTFSEFLKSQNNIEPNVSEDFDEMPGGDDIIIPLDVTTPRDAESHVDLLHAVAKSVDLSTLKFKIDDGAASTGGVNVIVYGAEQGTSADILTKLIGGLLSFTAGEVG